MFKRSVSLLLVALLICFSSAFASVGIQDDGVPQGAATNINFTNPGTSITNDGSTWSVPITFTGGVSSVVTGPTAIVLTYSVVRIGNYATRAMTLANGTAGQVLTIICYSGGASTITITPATKTGWTTATMASNGYSLTLQYIDDTYGWIVLGYSGTTINH